MTTMFVRPRIGWLGGWTLLAGATACAQMHHVDAPERVTRAVGVYEWTGELAKPTAARFVPVSLFIDGRFEDAGVYLARPIPFALQSGDLYTVERSGEPEGVLDLEMAERVVSGNALADDNPVGVWYGFGKFTADAPPKPGPLLHKSAHPGVIQSTPDPSKPHAATGDSTPATADENDGKPHMSRRNPATEGDSGQNGDAGAKGTSDSPTTSSGGKAQSSSGSSDDTDRPTLARRDPSQDAARQRTATGGKRGSASVTAVGPAPGDDPDRPTLTHKSAETATVKELTGLPADLHQAVAVSDPVVRDPHPFARPWEDAAERASTLQALEALARPRVAAYLTENELVPSLVQAPAAPSSQSTEGTAAAVENGAGAPPKLQRGKPTEYGENGKKTTAGTTTTRNATSTARAGTKPAPEVPLTLRDGRVMGFTLSYGGLPTFVYTASASAARRTPKGLPPAAVYPTAYVTVVAQRLPSGQLQVAMVTVTDSQHLDRSPQLRLIDAVDPDASHRASLLFELRGTHSRQFALYRLITARAENTFTSASIE